MIRLSSFDADDESLNETMNWLLSSACLNMRNAKTIPFTAKRKRGAKLVRITLLRKFVVPLNVVGVGKWDENHSVYLERIKNKNNYKPYAVE